MFDTGHGRHRDVDGWGRCRRVAAAGVAFTDAFERVEIRVCRHAPGEDRVRPNCREDQREERPTLCMEQNRKGKATLEGVLRFKDAPPAFREKLAELTGSAFHYWNNRPIGVQTEEMDDEEQRRL